MEETRIDYKRLLFFAFLGSLTILLLLRLAGASEGIWQSVNHRRSLT